MTMLAVFRSRAQALDAISRLGGAGVPAQAVSTPKEAGYGCGLSVRYDARFQARVAVLMIIMGAHGAAIGSRRVPDYGNYTIIVREWIVP